MFEQRSEELFRNLSRPKDWSPVDLTSDNLPWGKHPKKPQKVDQPPRILSDPTAVSKWNPKDKLIPYNIFSKILWRILANRRTRLDSKEKNQTKMIILKKKSLNKLDFST